MKNVIVLPAWDYIAGSHSYTVSKDIHVTVTWDKKECKIICKNGTLDYYFTYNVSSQKGRIAAEIMYSGLCHMLSRLFGEANELVSE
jgi:hypothetical protein